MKKKLLVAVAMLMTLGGVSRAQVEYTQGVAIEQAKKDQDYLYFFYNVGAKKFLAGGMDYGTRGTVDNAGRVIKFVTITGDGATGNQYRLFTRTFADPHTKNGHVGINGSGDCYMDMAWDNAQFQFESVEQAGYTNVYKIKNQNGTYLQYDKAETFVKYGELTEDGYSYWIIVPTEDRKAVGDYTYYLQNTDFNCTGNKPNFIWGPTDNLAIKDQEDKTKYINRIAQYWNANASIDISQTMPIVTNGGPMLPDGIYKLMCQGFYRPGGNKVNDADTENAMLYLNSAESPIKNIYKEVKAQQGNGFNNQDSGLGYVPGSHKDAAEVLLDEHNYNNEVIGVVTDYNLKIGIKKETIVSEDWLIFDNFRLTYLGSTTVNRNTATNKFGTICLPFEADVTGARLYTITDVADGTITLQQVSTAEAGVPYIYQATADNQTFTDKGAGTYVGTPKEDAHGLKGAFFTTDVPVGSYVMQTQGETQGFYKVASEGTVQCGANKCYLTLDAPAGVKALFFAMDDATAITTAEDTKRGDAQVHDLNGRPQPRLQKSVNIVNGKKIVVK